MLNKKNFFSGPHFNSKEFRNNLKHTKRAFDLLKDDLKKFKIPLFQSYEKDYILDFTPKTVKKFSRYKNIIIIGMGGSILGAKAIYSFLKGKIKKNLFFMTISVRKMLMN